jgi:hypothetical protein
MAKRVIATKANQPVLVQARAVRSRKKAPALLRASATNQAVAFQTLVFVVETRALQAAPDDASDAVVWNLSVWQVTVIRPVRNQVEPGIVAKSI